MDQIAKIQQVEILEVLQPTCQIFQEILEKRKSVITDVPRRTFRFGSGERQNLDIYYPPTSSSGKTPILFFVYGGGFVHGNRNQPPPFDLAYSCLGAFFARQGFITVIADYRLVPSVNYPGPAEDIRDAIAWVLANRNELVSQTTPNPDTDSLFIAGHSAGGTHAATVILDENVLPVNSPIRAKIKGLILMSGIYHFESDSGFTDTAKVYWGDEEKVKKFSPLPLLRSANSELIARLPKLLLVEAEREPPALAALRIGFQEAWESILKTQVKYVVAKGHNHISLFYALSSGEGEEWAVESSNWMRSVLDGKA